MYLILFDIKQKRLHPNNCLEIRRFADMLMCGSLVEKANKYIEQRFLEVSKAQEYLRLTLSEVCELLSKTELNVSSEEQVSDHCIFFVLFS